MEKKNQENGMNERDPKIEKKIINRIEPENSIACVKIKIDNSHVVNIPGKPGEMTVDDVADLIKELKNPVEVNILTSSGSYKNVTDDYIQAVYKRM